MGLLGFPGLRGPADFERLMEKSRRTIQLLRDEIVSTDVSQSEESRPRYHEIGSRLLNLTDEISNNLCIFLDAMEFLRNSHPDRKMQHAAQESLLMFSSYLHELNTDIPLHAKITEMVENKDLFETLDEVEKRDILLLKHDMERNGGVQLLRNEKMKQRMIDLNSRVDVLNAEFMQSIHEARAIPLSKRTSDNLLILDSVKDLFDGWDLTQEKGQEQQEEWSTAKKNRIETLVRHMHRSAVSDPNMVQILPSGKTVVKPGYYSHLIDSHPDPELRRRAYVLRNKASDDSLQILDSLISTRDELAHALNKRSYAHMYTAENMIGSPERVVEFLEHLSQTVKRKSMSEIELLQNYKRQLWDVTERNGDDTISEWDKDYLENLIRADLHLEVDDTREYFPLEQCLEGLYLVCREVFGVELQPMSVSRSELWDDKVRKFAVVHETEGLKGYLYFDVFPRKNKSTSPSNFTIRCAKKLIGQLPVACMSCSFVPASTPFLLSHDQVQTLFHEFGHALHVLLGHTKYQNTAGTRTTQDFVEAPSQFMENFTWDYRVVSRFARHHLTGEVLPEEKLDALRKASQLFSALYVEEQILFALADITFFGEQTWRTRSDGSKVSTTDMWRSLRNKYNSIPYTEGTSNHGTFYHFTNYAAGYYSYLHSHVISAHIWQKLFQQDPFDRKMGERYVQEVLAPGGGKDPKEIVSSILDGEQPDPKYLMRELGINGMTAEL